MPNTCQRKLIILVLCTLSISQFTVHNFNISDIKPCHKITSISRSTQPRHFLLFHTNDDIITALYWKFQLKIRTKMSSSSSFPKSFLYK